MKSVFQISAIIAGSQTITVQINTLVLHRLGCQ